MCGANTYSAPGMTSCSNCHANSQAEAGSDNSTDCICQAGYYGAHGGPCMPCQIGKYKATPGSHDCAPCPDNSWHSIFDEAETTAECYCNAGYTGPFEACAPCAAGKAKSAKGSAACSGCSDNQYSPAAAAGCTGCPAKSVSPALSTTITDCVCSLGHYGPAGGVCQDCDLGKYTNTEGRASCEGCATGTYQDSTEATACLSCPANTISSENSSAMIDCQCNPGYSGPDGGICVACSEGKYKPANGTSACSDCGISTYADTTGQSACDACPANATTALEASDALSDCQCNDGYTGPR